MKAKKFTALILGVTRLQPPLRAAADREVTVQEAQGRFTGRGINGRLGDPYLF